MPFLRRCSEMRRVFSTLPVLMGMMGVADPMVSYPRLVMPFASFSLFAQSCFKRSIPFSANSREARDAAMTQAALLNT
jgi:hypothetical protein